MPEAPLFFEARNAPIWTLITGIIFSFSLSIALVPRVGWPLGVLLLIVMTLIAIRLWLSFQSHVSITENFVHVGKAKLERHFIADATLLNREEFLQRIRTGASPTDYFALRRLDYGGIVLGNTDVSDPFKHWVISLKHGQEFLNTLNRSQYDNT